MMDELVSRRAVLVTVKYTLMAWSYMPEWRDEKIIEAIAELPPIQPEIIHCGDGCKFWNRHAGEQAGTCDILRQCTSDSFYCGNAKRNEVNHESN